MSDLYRKYFLSVSGFVLSAVLFFCLFDASAQSAQQPSVYPQISPQPVIVGEEAELRLLSTTGYPNIADLPKIPGIKWTQTSPMTSQEVNMTTREVVFKTIYPFTATKEGEITIPSMKIRLGHLTEELPPLNFKAYKRKFTDSTGRQIPIDDLLFMSALLMTNRNYIYVGEEVPLEIRMYAVSGLPVSCTSWPQVDAENIVMKDYSSISPQSSYFLPPESKTVRLKGQSYNANIFRAAIKPIAPGTLKGKVIVPCTIKVPRQNTRRRTGDPFEDFFQGSLFGSRYRNLQYKLSADFGPLKVKELPPVPSDAYFLGLVGEWQMKISLSSNHLKTGDPVTLTVAVRGKGSIDALSAPEISLEGFRIYPPEVKKSPVDVNGFESAVVQYALIPKTPGRTSVNLAFSTFSPIRQKYIPVKFFKNFNVEKGESVSSGFVDDTASSVRSKHNSSVSASQKKVQNGILYLKQNKMGAVRIPLRDNNIFWIIFLFLIGPAVFIVAELLAYRNRKLSTSPHLKRKSNAKRRKVSVISRIKEAQREDELHEIIQNDLTPLINDFYGYPPGTSTDELAEKVDDPKLAACLRAGSSSSYMPGHNAEFNAESLKKHLLKAVKRLSVVILLFCSLSMFAAKENTEQNTFDKNDPVSMYINGNPAQAEAIYRKKLDPKKPDPAWLYDLGNCAVQEGNLPKALVYYERARRLAPSDSDILENLNYVRRKLVQPEIGISNNPIESLENFRDAFRPDHWLLAIACFWTLAWLVAASRRFMSVRKWSSALIILTIAFALCIVAYISQMHSTYNPASAIVVKQGTPVYTLPSLKSGDAGFKLRAGEAVTIEEERHRWLRVREGHSEGWVKSDAVERLWPY